MGKSLEERKIEASSYARQEIIELMFRIKEFSKEIEQKGSVGENFEAYKFSAYAFRDLSKYMEDFLDGFNQHIDQLNKELEE